MGRRRGRAKPVCPEHVVILSRPPRSGDRRDVPPAPTNSSQLLASYATPPSTIARPRTTHLMRTACNYRSTSGSFIQIYCVALASYPGSLCDLTAEPWLTTCRYHTVSQMLLLREVHAPSSMLASPAKMCRTLLSTSIVRFRHAAARDVDHSGPLCHRQPPGSSLLEGRTARRASKGCQVSPFLFLPGFRQHEPHTAGSLCLASFTMQPLAKPYPLCHPEVLFVRFFERTAKLRYPTLKSCAE